MYHYVKELYSSYNVEIMNHFEHVAAITLRPLKALELTFRAADVERVGDVAGQTHVQRAAGAFGMRLGSREGQYTVGVVELPAKWYHAALHIITRLLTYKA